MSDSDSGASSTLGLRIVKRWSSRLRYSTVHLGEADGLPSELRSLAEACENSENFCPWIAPIEKKKLFPTEMCSSNFFFQSALVELRDCGKKKKEMECCIETADCFSPRVDVRDDYPHSMKPQNGPESNQGSAHRVPQAGSLLHWSVLIGCQWESVDVSLCWGLSGRPTVSSGQVQAKHWQGKHTNTHSKSSKTNSTPVVPSVNVREKDKDRSNQS